MAYFDLRAADEYKLVVLVREDLKMTRGKIAAQTGHAVVNCLLSVMKKDSKSFERWTLNNQPIIVLRVNSEKELFEFKAILDAQSINNSVVCDAGRTEVEPGTITCMGIGPAAASVIDKITGELKML
ncbi:peptidyl-tRNA hydrolase [Candidatus Methanoplasma termitum]|uniref:Peptidyl-tRNA hydrolase n=1 Tax=Candidatus Methanoplasma termitum TaxID=1577791 RepID=A0A0A7LAJ5_9ARCH|nr:peptidyl-tRNA hydrolase Pth2 [Candidatus Methanoplasma termitum]AIZ56160.1 peptidyl-tRNA hydrolase [Candidatus Methanoplasma termitum]